jgi:hypothetical protein
MSKANFGHDLSGLIRFAEREPWDERLVDMLALHLDPVCEANRKTLLPLPPRFLSWILWHFPLVHHISQPISLD